MTVQNIITTDESDEFLADSSDWLGLTDAVKSSHILTASVHMVSNWECLDVDWDDLTTVNDDLKWACALYAEADRLGVLYPNKLSTSQPQGRVVEETRKLGSLSKTTRWNEMQGPVNSGRLNHINQIMSLYCYKIGGSSTKLTRV